MVDTQERGPLTDEPIVLNETIHQSTRLRIMTMLVGMPETDRLAYGFIQKTLDLDRRKLDHPSAQAGGRGLPGHNERVPGLQAAHMGRGDTDGASCLCRISLQP